LSVVMWLALQSITDWPRRRLQRHLGVKFTYYVSVR
jgi:hypothetical protein